MSLVNAKCTNCGSQLKVDSSKETAICEYCGSTYIVEKAITNYNNTINIDSATINVAGVNVDNLNARAKQFEDEGDVQKAKEYYNQVLDIDINNVYAKEGIDRLTPKYRSVAGYSLTEEQFSIIDDAIKNNDKIEAIRIVREKAGYGLKDAKAIVDSYDNPNNTQEVNSNESSTKNANNSGGGCYVATAVYGSYDCPQVWTLRRYRDNELAKTWYGRAFIRTYYAISPTLVKWFGHTDWFKKMWRGKLDRMVQDLNSNGVENTPYNDIEW